MRLRQWPRAFKPAVFVICSIVAGSGIPAAASAAGRPPSNPCLVSRHDGLRLTITSPRPKATIDLAKSPLFTVAGLIRGGRVSSVTSVRLYADGSPVGYAKVAEASRRSPVRTWQIATSAAPGTHTVVACARTAKGVTARAVLTVRVARPSTAATISAPGVVVLPASTTDAISKVAGGALTFTGHPALTVGQVITAGVTAHTPQGLMRRVTGIHATSAGAVVSTVPAHLDEVFWQADLHLRNAPLQPASAPAKARRASGVTVPLPLPSINVPLKVDKSTPGAVISGTVALTGKATVELKAELDVDIKISTHWSWTSLPTVTLDEFRFAAHGTAEDKLSGSVTGSGKLTYTKRDIAPGIPLAPVVFSEVPPIVITPKIEINGAASLSLGGGMTISKSQSSEMTAGFDYVGGKIHSLDDAGITPGESSADVDPAATGTAQVYVQPDIAGYVDELIGPDAGLKFGVKVAAKLPCPGSVSVSPFLEVTASGEINLFVKRLSLPDVGVGMEKVAWQSSFPGCAGLAITTRTLPDGTVDTAYPATQLAATGGSRPYQWKATALPPGLSFAGDGTLTGTPTTAGAYRATAVVTDADGNSAKTDLAVTVGTHLTITTSRLPDAQVGTAYSASLDAAGGTGALTWSLASGSLPGGLSLGADGKITGQAATETAVSVTVTVTDESGASDTKAFGLTVDTKLPDPVVVVAPPAPDPIPACAGACATTWGDPHLVTYDGAHYDFQQVGEFVATKSETSDLQVQVRQQPYGGSRTIAVNTAAAFAVAGHRVGVYLAGSGARTLVDGVAVTPSPAGTALPGGGSLAGDGGRVTVRWPDGSLVTADLNGGSYLTLSFNLAPARRGHLTGLLGDADGASDNDLIAASRRVSPGESLFDYAPGESTATFTDTDFPYATVTSADLPAANRDAALAVCRAAGLPDGPLLDACVLDVAVTGDIGAATAAMTARANVPSSVIAASGAGDAWTDEHGATGTSALTYGHAGCIALDVNLACTGGTWTVVPQAPWIWTAQFSSDNQYTVTFTRTVQITASQAASPQTLTALADDNVVASVDGTPVSSGGYNSATTVTLHLTAGAHTLTFTASNNAGYDPQGNPGGLAWKLVAG
jgi:hypothetical protein